MVRAEHGGQLVNIILKAYEQVPEAYRQKFRQSEKTFRQTHVEFACEKRKLFERWCVSEDVESLENYCCWRNSKTLSDLT